MFLVGCFALVIVAILLPVVILMIAAEPWLAIIVVPILWYVHQPLWKKERTSLDD